jgi:hypothetical protein
MFKFQSVNLAGKIRLNTKKINMSFPKNTSMMNVANINMGNLPKIPACSLKANFYS